MIIKGKDVIGLNVVTVDTGTVIETVDDIAYDPINHRITALLVDSGGLFSSAKAIHIDDVRNIGEDAVIVPDASVIRSTKELASDVRSISDSNKHLVKTNVLTIDGKELGKVTDIFFDSENGYVETMEVSQGSIKTMTEGKKSIKPSDIVTIGADATIVSTYTEAVLEAQGEEGGLKGMFNDAKSKTEELAADAKEKVQDATDKTVAASKEFGEDVKEKSIELKDKAAVKADELRDDVEVQTARTRNAINDKAAEARAKADELRDDITEKSGKLKVAAGKKGAELDDATQRKSDEVKARAIELSDEVVVKSKELSRTANEKAREAKVSLDNATNETRGNVKHEAKNFKTEATRKVNSTHHTADTMVEKATEVYQDKDKIVKRKKTSVKKV